jgi:hypothetical protein
VPRPPRRPPRYKRLANDPWLHQHPNEPEFLSPQENAGAPDWFMRTYPGLDVEDLADYYRRTKNSPPVTANPENRFATFRMRMIGTAANPEETPAPVIAPERRVREDASWALVIAAVIVLAAAIVLAAVIANR